MPNPYACGRPWDGNAFGLNPIIEGRKPTVKADHRVVERKGIFCAGRTNPGKQA
jgi:hypothetical protein